MHHKIFILLWKDLLIRRNHYVQTAVEVWLPVVLILVVNLCLPQYVGEVDRNQMSFLAYKEDSCIPRHGHYGKVVYQPSTPFTDALIKKAACYAGYKKTSVKSGALHDNETAFSIGVKFENVNGSSIPHVLNYSLFPTNKFLSNNLHKLWQHYGTAAPKFSIPTLYSILELQRGIDSGYLQMRNISTPKLLLENTDVYERAQEVFILPIILALVVSYFLMVSPIVGRIVQEKHTGAKELMLMMGVKRWELWLSKFLDAFLFAILTASGIVLALCVPLGDQYHHLKISPILLWTVMSYGLTGFILSLFFITCFFEKPTLALYVPQVIWTFSLIICFSVSKYIPVHLFIQHLMCLFPHVALIDAMNILIHFDFYEKDVKFMERLSGKEVLSLFSIISMMTVNILLYLVLTWYMDQVNPGKYGVPQRYNFCFKKSYWSRRKVLTTFSNPSLNKTPDSFEPVSKNLTCGISIQGVTKIYKSVDKGSVTAVDDVSLDFYHREISGLLGHNGAGKTTVFSMITGLSYPTSGKITINGFDLSINIDDARRSLGLCPQQDMLFNDLTTIQTLKFFAGVKGLKLPAAKREAIDLVTKLKLQDVKNTLALNLSGGEKRKVSLAIALIGGSEVLVLDEPTASMDPEIRREIWEMLLELRKTRTILLTTHFMEEADALCDRIAVMDHGKIKCYGTPMFLKSRYGKGYLLSVILSHDKDIQERARELTDYIKQFVPAANLRPQVIRTLSFELPESDVCIFPALLTGLEEKKRAQQIKAYSISLSTLEDVFLRLSGHEEKDGEDTVDAESYKKLNGTGHSEVVRSQASFLFLFQLWALLVKKWIFFLRTFKTYAVYSILSFLLVLISTHPLMGKNLQSTNTKSLTFSLDLYPSSLALYSMPPQYQPFEKRLFKNLVEKAGSKAEEVKDIQQAIYDIFKDDFYTYAKKLIFGVEFSRDNLRIYHNEDAVYMVPVSLNFIHNYLLKYWYENDTIVTSVNSTYSNKELYPLPTNLENKCGLGNVPDFVGPMTLFYLFGTMKERSCGAKGLQLMIISATLYWCSHLLFDVLTFFLFLILLFLGVGITENFEILHQLMEPPGVIFFGFLFWGTAQILFTYVVSTVIQNMAAAFTITLTIYVVSTFPLYHIISLQGLPRYFQYLHPSCILKFGISNYCAGTHNNFIWALLLYNCVLFVFLVLKDSSFLSRVTYGLINRFICVDYSLPDERDQLVKDEEELVEKMIEKRNFSESVLLVSKLKRWHFKREFPVFPAVRGISFALNRGECFGLLGVNGAGKTTTFRILTGEIPPSHGTSYACSEKLTFFNRQKYLFAIGYCPQFGGIIPIFTGRELLTFFARLRGIHTACVRPEVHKWLEKMSLWEYADKTCGTYSGGNQRKLSTAVSLLGDSPLIFLDEPTTGVDPLCRRSIWNVIGDVQKEGQSIVLTSHSMDECEALCSRVSIMVKGRFQCIGELTTLKDRFGQGYCIQLKVSTRADKEAVNSLKEGVEEAFGCHCRLDDDHVTVLQYFVSNAVIGWADLFKKLEVLKEKFVILESYTASASTLEQIFIYFARNYK